MGCFHVRDLTVTLPSDSPEQQKYQMLSCGGHSPGFPGWEEGIVPFDGAHDLGQLKQQLEMAIKTAA